MLTRLVWTKCGFKHLHSDCSHVLWNFVLDLENNPVAHTMLGLTGTRVRVPGGEVFTWRMKLPVSNFVKRGSNASADVAKNGRQQQCLKMMAFAKKMGAKYRKGSCGRAGNTFLEAGWNKIK